MTMENDKLASGKIITNEKFVIQAMPGKEFCALFKFSSTYSFESSFGTILMVNGKIIGIPSSMS